MPLDERQKGKADDWLDEKGVKKCPACGAVSKLTATDRLHGLSIAEKGAPLGQGTKALLVTCANCAHMMLFNADMMKL
jgi:hypothetical protein